MNKKRIIWLYPALAFALLLNSCGSPQSQKSADGKSKQPVRLLKIEARNQAASEDVPGTVRSKQRANIEAKVPGRIQEMLVVEGQSVKGGDLLAKLKLEEAKAKLDQAVALRDQAERDLERLSVLVKKKAVSQAEYEGMESKARVARAAVLEAETMLGYGELKAPFNGIITKKSADVGDLAIPGRPILEIEDPSALRFEANLPEAFIAGINLGSSLNVRLAAADSELQGVVAEIAPTADPNSRTFLVKLDIPQDPSLRSGKFGHVVVPTQPELIISVPQSSLRKRGQMEMLYVMQDGKAMMRLVRTGKKMGADLEILSGLEDGELIILDVDESLKDGQAVEVVQ